MKRIFSLTLLLISLSLGAFAQNGDVSTLRLRLSDGGIIAVNLDGRYIFRNTTSLTLDGIRPGLHRIEVYRDYGARYRPRRIYTGTIRLREGNFYDGLVDTRRRTLQLRSDAGRERTAPIEEPRQPDNRNETPDRAGQDEIYPPGTPQNGREGYGSFPHGRPHNGSGYSAGSFSARDMSDLHTRVDEHITDTDKEKLMKRALGDRSPSTAQVRDMLGWFSFESTRLDFAKWAYARVSDKDEYWKLEDVFSFESSKEEFSQTIGR
jgi:hypothetical protein